MIRPPVIVAALLVCLFWGTSSSAESTATPSAVELVCSSAGPGTSTTTHAARSFRVTLINRSTQPLSVLWPDDVSLLLIMGRLRMTIEDDRGERYSFVPPPGPVIVARKEHFKTLPAGGRETREISLCGFRDSRNSESPCSLKSRFKIQAVFEISDTQYWEESQNRYVRMAGAWTGKAVCEPVDLDAREK